MMCVKCGRPGEFYARMSTCKECVKERVKANYRKQIKKRKAYERKRCKSPDRRQYMTDASRKHREAFPEKYKARTALNNAVRDGRVARLGCEVCGTKAQAHHDDYGKPLVVRWLCQRHHDEEHGDAI